MSRETSKCIRWRREQGHFARYLRGDGIDIGCGDDPLIVPDGTVRQWDRADGDAQYMAGVPDASFDFVYSSHCLEHMVDVPATIHHWLRILKPGGYLYVVVPDYVFYEKCMWPSHYNTDHKHTFSGWVTRPQVGRPNHWTPSHLAELTGGFDDWGFQTDGFDFNNGAADQTLGDALSQLFFIARKG